MSTAGHIAGFILLGIIFAILQIWIVNPMIKNKDKIKDIEFTINTSQKTLPPKSYNATPAKAQIPQVETKSNSSSAPKSNTKPSKKTNSTKIRPIISKNAIGDFTIPIPKIKPLSGSRGGISRRVGGSASGSSYGNSSSQFLDDDATGSSGSSVKGGGFDKNATRKVVSTYDMGPYVSELKRNIRWNWKSPKENGKTVELFLRIAKDGKVVILNVKRTSEVGAVDDAALNAVRKTIPLNPLPSQYKKGYLDVIFTFNSNSSSLGSRF